jgi:hypothetical protein
MEYLAIVIIALSILAYLIYKVDIKNLDDCEHKNIFIHVEEAIVGCEKTTITCLDCKKRLSTKTDCR